MEKKDEKIKIPGASKYAIDAKGNVTNIKSDTPVFPKDGKVRLYCDKGTRIPYDVKVLVRNLHKVELDEVKGELPKKETPKAPAVEKTDKKTAPKKEPVERKQRGTIIVEIQKLFAKGKTREQVLALETYNKSTVNVQWGKFKKANEK